MFSLDEFYLYLKIIIYIYIYIYIVGSKNLATPAHFISSLRPTPRRNKCLRTNKEGPNCQETLSRTILFLANQDHERRKRHTTNGSLPERHKGKHKRDKSAMGV